MCALCLSSCLPSLQAAFQAPVVLSAFMSAVKAMPEPDSPAETHFAHKLGGFEAPKPAKLPPIAKKPLSPTKPNQSAKLEPLRGAAKLPPLSPNDLKGM